MQFTPYIVPIAVSAVLLAALALTAWRHRATPGAIVSCLLMLATAEWSLAYTLQLSSFTLPLALFWNSVAWIGAVLAPTLWLIFALQYTGRARWLSRQNLVILLIEPFITLLLVWTIGLHGLIESNPHLSTAGPFSALIVTYGVLYWVNVVYSYVILLLGAFVICSFILTVAYAASLYSVQGVCLLAAILVPWVANILTLLGLSPIPHLDLTPFAFLISCLVVSLGLFLFRLFDITPVAREIVIENIGEATIVLDAQDRVVDLNPVARRFIDYTATKAIGRPFVVVFSAWKELVERFHNLEEGAEAVITGVGEEPRYFGLRITPLYRRKSSRIVYGRLIVLHDITERMKVERALKESEGRFLSIFTEVPIGMAVMDRQGHMLQVNKAFCQMLGYDDHALLGLKLSTLIHPDDDSNGETFPSRQAIADGKASYKVEKRFLKKNQETLWADLTATILRNYEGETFYSLVMLENIIERKRARLLEEERHYVAYELHDGLAQVAASTHQHLQALANHYHPRSRQARQELDQALELAQRSVQEARRIIAGLRPTVLDDFGLATALRLLVEAQRNEGLTILFEERLGTERLTTAIETTLFGVATEALNNVRKHARTSNVRLILERRALNVHLIVQDWGCGFETRTLLKAYFPGEHVGIHSMQERIELVGGHLLIFSQPGVGTLVKAEIPALAFDGSFQRDEQ